VSSVAERVRAQRYWFNLHDGPEQEARDARLAEGCTEAQEAMGDFPFLYLDTKVQGCAFALSFGVPLW
jgi:hypothetical protein